MRRTSPDKEREILTSILMGDTYAIASKKTGIPVSTIKKIKKRNDETVAKSYAKLADEQAENANDLVRKTNKQIAKLLAKADMGLVDISINDLCRISSAMYEQTVINSLPLRSVQSLTKIAQKYR